MLASDARWSAFDFRMGEFSLVLACYLDDSSDQSTVSALGGYVARTEDWRRYEKLAPEVYRKFDLKVLHTKDLHATKGEFEFWTGEKKLNFVEELFDAAKSCGVIGVSACVRNSTAKKFKRLNRSKQKISVLGLLFARVVLSFNIQRGFYPVPHPCPDLSLIIETGNCHNNGVLEHFNLVREKGSGFEFAKELSFVGKKDCYAIQLADFWAFYSRRHGSRILTGKLPSLEVDGADVIQNTAERIHAVAAYRCIHHLKLINKVYLPENQNGVMTIADSYTFDPNDFMLVPE